MTSAYGMLAIPSVMVRVVHKARKAPMPTPASAVTAASWTTIRATSRRRAPNATRTANSRNRRLTE